MSSKSYWDLFYTSKSNTNFEWLLDNTCLDNLTTKLKQSKHTFLADIGCGSSQFSWHLSRELSPNLLICADFSRQPLNYLKEQTKNKKVISDFIQCDCKRLPLRNDLFDLILDKGYLDSVLKQLSLVPVEKAMHETHVSLKALIDKLDSLNIKSSSCNNNKYLIQITDEPPELRFELLDEFRLKYALNINYFYKEIPLNEFVYYAYFISKQ